MLLFSSIYLPIPNEAAQRWGGWEALRLTHGAAGIGVQDPYIRKTQGLEWLHTKDTKEQKQTEKGPQRE